MIPLGKPNIYASRKPINGNIIHDSVCEFLRRHESACADNRIANVNALVRQLDETVSARNIDIFTKGSITSFIG